MNNQRTMALNKILILLCWRLMVTTARNSSCPLLGATGVRRDWWMRLHGGYYLKHLKDDNRFQNNIDFETNYLKHFDAPRNFGIFYGQRLSAYFIPMASGTYTFIATCDSECEILLSDDESPARKRVIINIDQNHRTKYNEWDRYAAQRSCPQELNSHAIYYIEALHSNYKRDDHLRLRVIYPGQQTFQIIDEHQLIRYSGKSLHCDLMQLECGYLCGADSVGTIVREIDPVTKLCTMPRSTLPTTTSTIASTTTQITTKRTAKPKTTIPRTLHLNITTKSTSSTTIQVFWSLRRDKISTNVEGYRLDYTENHSTEKYSSFVESDVKAVELTRLKKNTLYCIRIFIIVGRKAKESDGCHYARTLEDVPSKSPTVQVQNKALTSILVTWQPINKNSVHGRLQGYKMYITNMDTNARPEVIKTGSATNSMTVNGVAMNVQYCVRLLGFTVKGDGPLSPCTVIRTWTDDFLPKMTVHNFTSTTSINITWDDLPGYLAGHVIAYKLSYTVSELKGKQVQQSFIHLINVTANTKELSIGGLTIFTVYRFEVRPLTKRGLGLTSRVAFGATCRCQKYLKALWSPIPPYAVETSTGNPTGMIPKLLSTMVDTSCGQCHGHKSTKIIYELKSNRLKRDLALEDEEADFIFPIRKADKRSKDESEVYIPLLEVPGFAFLTSVKSKQEYAQHIATSVFDCWPVLAISLAMTLLSGVLLWFVELIENRGSPRRTNVFRGINDGVWWSFATMTTVGYGDQIPRTNGGRCFAIIWLFIGIVLVALLVGSITSSLSVKILKEQLYVKRDKKIASVEDPLDYNVLMHVDERASTRTTYQDMESLIKALKQGNTEGIIVDMYLAGFRTDLFNGSWYKVSSILDRKFFYGVSINGNAASLAKRFKDYSLKTYEVELKLLQEERQKEKVSNQFNIHSQTVRKDIDLLNPRTLLYQMTIFFSLTVLGSVGILAILVHSWKKNRKREKKKELENVQDPREEYIQLKQEMKTMLDNFYRQFVATYVKLKLKHRQEKLDFINYKKQRMHEIVWL